MLRTMPSVGQRVTSSRPLLHTLFLSLSPPPSTSNARHLDRGRSHGGSNLSSAPPRSLNPKEALQKALPQ